jgi:hypothetical protein
MRAETRPEGREAVERVHVSGTCDWSVGSENQVWNWVRGEGEREVRCRVPMWNCAARVGCEGSEPGAKISWEEEGLVSGREVCSVVLVVSSELESDDGAALLEGVCSILKVDRIRRRCCRMHKGATNIFRGKK